MTAWSFEKFNYLLRPNKNVERKIMLDLLLAFNQSAAFKLSDYQYVGFSSVYYADAILFHRRLGIRDFVSMEKVASRSKRLDFNKPYSCVTVLTGLCSELLPTLEWAKPQFVWLDYDGVLDMSMFADVQTTLSRLKSRDFVFLTVNAELAQLQNVKTDGRELKTIEALSQVAPTTAIPTDADDRLATALFPELVGEIWSNYIRSTIVASASGLKFVPLLNIHYADGARMVTYGGVLLNEADLQAVNALDLTARFGFLSEKQFELVVPSLTHKEKLELDRRMPAVAAPKWTVLPFELKQTEVDAYWRFYLHYPTYGELGP